MLGLDLYPRLRKLKYQKLFVPRGVDVPISLRSIIGATVPLKAIERDWDEFVRLAASIQFGWCSAKWRYDVMAPPPRVNHYVVPARPRSGNAKSLTGEHRHDRSLGNVMARRQDARTGVTSLVDKDSAQDRLQALVVPMDYR